MTRTRKRKSGGRLRVPGQFEAQACIYLAYPSNGSSVPAKKMRSYTDLPTIQSIQASIIAKAHNVVRVVLIVSSMEELRRFVRDYRPILKGSHFYYYVIKHCDIWIRDTGMEFLCGRSRQVLVDHNFTLWGYREAKIRGSWKNCDIPNKIPRAVARLQGIPVESFVGRYAAEGGNRSFNGRGVCIANVAVELQRNAPMSLSEIESYLLRAYRLKKIIWLVAGVKDDDMTNFGPMAISGGGQKTYTAIGTGGHTDELCRFVGPSTVVLAGLGGDYMKKYGYIPSQIVVEGEARCAVDYNILKRHKVGGRHLTIARLPLPEVALLEVGKGDGIYSLIQQVAATPVKGRVKIAPASSYVNFLVTNKQVFVPAFSRGCKLPGVRAKLEKTDEMARRTFRRLFPKREIIQINNMAYNVGGGGFNCTYSSQPLEGFKPTQEPRTSISVGEAPRGDRWGEES